MCCSLDNRKRNNNNNDLIEIEGKSLLKAEQHFIRKYQQKSETDDNYQMIRIDNEKRENPL